MKPTEDRSSKSQKRSRRASISSSDSSRSRSKSSKQKDDKRDKKRSRDKKLDKHKKHSESKEKRRKDRDREEDEDDEDDWVEKPSDQLVRSNEKYQPENDKVNDMEPPPSKETEKKDDSDDYFNSLGTQLRGQAIRDSNLKKKLEEEDRKRQSSSIKRLGAGDPNYKPDEGPPPPPQKPTPGGPGYQWRLIKLKRTYETAEEEKRPLEEVAIERYGSLEAWNEAIEERRLVEEDRQNNSSRSSRNFESDSSQRNTPNKSFNSNRESYGRKYVFTNEDSYSQSSRPGSSSGFRRPVSNVGTPNNEKQNFNVNSSAMGGRRIDQLKNSTTSSSSSNPPSPSRSSPSTPIPSVINPLMMSQSASSSSPSSNNRPPTSNQIQSSTLLNKLQAKLMKAKLMDPSSVPGLEKEYKEALEEVQKLKLNSSNDSRSERVDQVEMVPSIDGRGRMYDFSSAGSGPANDDLKPGNRKPKPNKFETRDPKTGELIRINEDDDKLSLEELVRQERFKGGSSSSTGRDLDLEFAKRIVGDSKFENDLDYIDDNSDRLARKSMKTESSKRLFAINDYARTKKALENCKYCINEEGDGSRGFQQNKDQDRSIISMGTRVYLSCTHFEELVEGHCLIVPIQHCLCSLEVDDDVWEEIKNYMKCLMRFFSESKDQGVLFFETVLSFKNQNHSYIEAVPVPWNFYNDAHGYFRESILTSESEWTQNKKLIDFSKKSGGFRSSMVSNLPYFMVMFDYKGQKGYGHVIEESQSNNNSSSRKKRYRGNNNDDSGDIFEGTGFDDFGDFENQFPRYFASEIIGNVLELEPRKWLRPKRVSSGLNRVRALKYFNEFGYGKFDWTGSI